MLDCASATFVHNASITVVNPREYDKYPGLSTLIDRIGPLYDGRLGTQGSERNFSANGHLKNKPSGLYTNSSCSASACCRAVARPAHRRANHFQSRPVAHRGTSRPA